MKLKSVLSALTAAVMAVPCMYAPPVSSISSQSTDKSEYEEPLIYIPDFPQEILDEFDINWTGLASNVHSDNTVFDFSSAHNEFWYDGGYALYSDQNYGTNICYVFRWHECSSCRAYQSMDFPLSDYTENLDLSLDMFLDVEIKESGDFRAGPLLELNGGKEELFIIEKFTAEAVFPENEKIGSYTADDKEYDLYMQSGDGKNGAPVRYYAVNKDGLTDVLAIDDNPRDEYSLSVSDHLANLKRLAETDIKLDKYGILCEGSDGVGFSYYRAGLKNAFYPLPEEELSLDDNGEPVVYKQQLMKNLDGYRYSLQTDDSGWPLIQDEEGRYYITSHENNSYIIPKGDGKLSAMVSDGIFGTVSSGREFDGKTPLLDKDYRLDYEYTVNKEYTSDEDDSYSPAAAASVWTLEPYIRLDYQEKSNIGDISSGYLGTIEVDGEVYEIHSSDIYSIDMAPLGNPSEPYQKSYLFIHMNGKESQSSGVKKGSFPITRLAEAAKAYGIEVGKLARIDLNFHNAGEYTIDILKNDIVVGERTDTDPGNDSRIYVDVAKSPSAVNIDPYTFSAYTNGYMYGYENGCFSAGSDVKQESAFEAGIEKTRNGRHIINTDKEITADYNIENNYKDSYQIEYYLSGTYDNVYEIYHIIENSENYPFENNFIGSVAGMYRSPAEPRPEFVKTYTADGHTYDLYKDFVSFSGCFSSTVYHVYVSIRQDQEEGEALEGSVNFKEHLGQIHEKALDGMNIDCIFLRVDTGRDSGTVKALKNDISLETFDVPWTIVGDFNDDLRVDSFDLVAARKELLNQLADRDYYSPGYKDINHDGDFNVADIVMLQSYILGKIKTLPEIY